MFTLGSAACSSRPKREEPPQQQASVTSVDTEIDPVLDEEDGSVSGAPSSLGAPSSGRGH